MSGGWYRDDKSCFFFFFIPPRIVCSFQRYMIYVATHNLSWDPPAAIRSVGAVRYLAALLHLSVGLVGGGGWHPGEARLNPFVAEVCVSLKTLENKQKKPLGALRFFLARCRSLMLT